MSKLLTPIGNERRRFERSHSLAQAFGSGFKPRH